MAETSATTDPAALLRTPEGFAAFCAIEGLRCPLDGLPLRLGVGVRYLICPLWICGDADTNGVWGGADMTAVLADAMTTEPWRDIVAAACGEGGSNDENN